MPQPEIPLIPDDERDERDRAHPYDEPVESYLGKDLDELQDEFDDEQGRQSER